MSPNITLEGSIFVLVSGFVLALLLFFPRKSSFSNNHDWEETDEIVEMTKKTHLTLSNSEWYLLERRAERDRMCRDEYLAWLVSRHLDGSPVSPTEEDSDD